MVDITSLRPLAIRAARVGGQRARAMFDELMCDGQTGVAATRLKSSATDPVTEIDLAVERLLRDLIHAERPGDAFLGEEGTSGEAPELNSGVRWIVDPIDGTVNLLYSQPFSAVSIAAEVDGQVVAGAVYAFHLGELWSAERGRGATHEDASGVIRPIQASGCTQLSMALVGTGFSYDSSVRAEQGALLATVLPQVRDIRRCGSAALDLCMVASGRLDAYYERCLKEWDYAAGVLIAEESGAKVGIAQGTHQPTWACAPGLSESFPTLVCER